MTKAGKSSAGELLSAARAALDGGRFAEAEQLYALAVREAPAEPDTHHDRGGFFKLLGRLDEAETELREALRLRPGFAPTRHALGTVLLSQGRYAEGWPLYDARHEIPALGLPKPQMPYAEWRGEPLEGKSLLIFGEQGLGDQIMYARFARQFAAQGADVTLFCQPQLARLFQALGVRVVPMSGRVDFPDPDYWVMSSSLPGRAGATLESVGTAPYLVGAPRAEGRIGVVARGNPQHTNDRNRSLPLAETARLMALPGAISLLPEDTGAGDLQATADIIAGLDLVISVDTAVAHLAGALGKPVWILLPGVMNDWRWLEGREDSPWYPTVRLLRQSTPGDWGPVLDQVAADLAALGLAPPPPPMVRGAPPDVASARKAVIARAETDIRRWSDAANLEPGWHPRAHLAANMIPRGARVLDLGCGDMHLEQCLPDGCAYLPCDVVRRDARTRVCNFNEGEFPGDLDCDVVTVLGVLEYIYDTPRFLRQLRALNRPVVLSYCPGGPSGPPDRGALGWVNDFTLEQLTRKLAEAGFEGIVGERMDPRQVILRLKPKAPPRAAEKNVWVVSFNNIDNFGDRLGVHLLNRILPSNATVRHVHHNPWDAPPDGDIDLLLLGLGNSLFGTLLTDDLLALMDRARAKVGLFGTQYRSRIDPARLGQVIGRLDAWYARSQEDLLLYGRGLSQARHMGDWLIDAFPLAKPTDSATLDLGTALRPDLALDRAVELIQRHRRVFSPRLHPLLCALTSAEEVAYQEQRPTGGEASGKFRSLFLDIFGVDKPEQQFWRVEREDVAAYKATVSRNIEDARRTIAALLG